MAGLTLFQNQALRGLRRYVRSQLFLFLAVILAVTLDSGCTFTRRNSAFLTLKSALHEGTFFKSQHVLPGRDFSNFHKVQIKLVDLKYLEPDLDYDASEIRRLRDFFQGELENKLSQGYLIIDRDAEPDGETLVVEPVLTFVSPPQHYVRSDGKRYATGISMATGMAAFEAKLLDGSNGHLLAEIAEQQSDGKSVKSVTSHAYRRYANTEAVFTKWSIQLLAMLEALTGKRPFHDGFTGEPAGLLLQDIRAIQELHQQWRELELSGDHAGLLGMCAEEIRWMPPDGLPLQGKDAVRQEIARQNPEVSSIMITDRQIQGGGSVAYLTSHYSKVYRTQGAVLARTIAGENLWILRKFPGQGWRIVVNAWNQAAEGSGAPAASV